MSSCVSWWEWILHNQCATDYDVEGVDDEENVEAEDCKPHEVNLINLGAAGPRDHRLMMPPVDPQIKGELIEINSDFTQKRKQLADDHPQMVVDQKIFTCEYSRCPYNDYRLGFLDRNSRNNHQMNCPYQSTNSSQVFGVPNSQINDDKPTAFSLRFAQPKPAYVSGLGLPEDGQKMISELMSFYDTNLQSDKSMNPGNLKAPEDHHHLHQQQQKFQLQMDDNYFSQGVILGGNMSAGETTNMSMHHHTVLPTTEIQFDQCKAFDPPFDNNPTDNIVDFRFSSPFNLGSVDYAVDSLPKQDIPLWYL